jgi:hypothetical protein
VRILCEHVRLVDFRPELTHLAWLRFAWKLTDLDFNGW